ncbi:hypothetical protein CCAX7_52630 [Capsulimonas corticalis]|uniref:Carbohydrate esterase 2 N-terminal domain-containing protein n=1 Tax=Capsulimonas corticalis TaxID=2219043 RepID=A0A402CNS2_9BACT|nr:hypothetical protein [Capsulimonas corticalis]BDI33212.1 hypothetical protein CCAX7_52630 [Capsulimonas corticalis]
MRRRSTRLWLGLCVLLGSAMDGRAATLVSATDSHIAYSPYNWCQSVAACAQSPNPGAYLKMGFTGTSLAVNLDVSPETQAPVPVAQYPILRYSVDGKAPVTTQLTPTTTSISCAAGLSGGPHTLRMQLVAGYVFLDFWTPVNVVRITGFTLDDGAVVCAPSGADALQPHAALFYGDSITNGDNTVANFKDGVTNATETQDATVGYVQPIAAALGAEYGVVAYGGASWDSGAADSHTPGLMTFWQSFDSTHSRLVSGKLSPIPDDIFVNMGENRGPAAGDVSSLLTSLRAASSTSTNIWIIVPFSGRARTALTEGFASYRRARPKDQRAFLLDIGDNPYLTDSGATMLAVDGQHPLAALDALLGAQLIQARASKLRETLGAKRRRP